jgi:uncharacterized protein YbjT (DUF2867 family)
MILITGATGKVGGEAVKLLKSAGIPFRALTRNPNKAKDFDDFVIGDLTDKAAVMQALDGVDKALMIVPNGEDQLSIEMSFTDACINAGVKQLVKLSSLESVPGTTNPITKMHLASENYIRSTNLEWTILKPTFFCQNFNNMAATIREKNCFSLPVGDGTVAPTEIRDVGEVIVKVLIEDQHNGKVYMMTGPDLVTFHTIAEIFTKALGRKISYVDEDITVYQDRLRSAGLAEWRIAAVCDEFRAISGGVVDHTTNVIKKLLGKDPASLTQYI